MPLAAYSEGALPGDGIEAEEHFSFSWLTNHAVYVICTHNFGFAGQINSRAIVDLSEETVPDKSLVIAIHEGKTLARRLVRSPEYPAIVSLVSEAENPLHRPNSLVLRTEEVRLLRVIGVLFEDEPFYPRSAEEAVLIHDWSHIEKAELVFRIRGDSALPLALSGQIILGGANLKPSDLPEKEGHRVAVATSEGTSHVTQARPVMGAKHDEWLSQVGSHLTWKAFVIK